MRRPLPLAAFSDRRSLLARRLVALVVTALLTLDLTAIGVPAALATVSRNWIATSPSSSPSPRWGAAMTGDQEKAVLFGGSTGTSGYSDDTWTYDGGTFQWTYRPLTPRPSGRTGAAMAFDFNYGYGVMFGGMNGSGTLSDTWLYDFYTNQWVDGTPTTGPSPSPRHGAMMGHAVNEILLFGGMTSTGTVLSDTWMYDVNSHSWTQLSPKTSPYGDAYATMTSSGFLSFANRSTYKGPVLLGPDGPGGSYGTWTWEWSSEIPSGWTWVQQSPSVSPPPRARAAMTFDTGARDVVLFGGRESSGAYRADTWTYDGVTWTLAAPATAPPARADSAMATVRFGSSSLLLFGGTGSSGRLGDSWLYRTPEPPTAPTGLAATAGDRKITLSWTAPTNNGGTPILGYNVYVGTISGGQDATPANGSTLITTTSYNVTGLTNLTTYWVVVKAVSAAGESVPSNEVSAQPTAAPVAVDDAYTTAEDAKLEVSAPGVLSNDTVGTGTLTVTAHTAPTHGTVAIGGDGGFTYTPTANHHGTDTFTYTARDGVGRTATATVTITVTSVYDPPTAADDTYMTTEDVALDVAAPGVLGNDTGVDGTLVVDSHTDPAHGALSLQTDGSFVYTPATDWSGEDAFTYTAADGAGGTATASVTITVSPATHTGDFWTSHDPVHKPPLVSSAGDFGGAMAPDHLRGTVVFFAVDGSTWTWDGTDWTLQHPTTVPDQRSGYVMGWDGYKVVLFGGLNASDSFTTTIWAWDGTNWMQQREYGSSRPSGRTHARMAWDANLNAVVLYGGNAGNGSCLGDTWLWKRASGADREQWGWWTSTSAGPSPTRCRPQMASDGDGGVVMFGGWSDSYEDVALADTWTFQGAGTQANPYRWVRQYPATSPAARHSGGMAFDASTGDTLLFAGWNYANSWVSDGQSWTWDRGSVTWNREFPSDAPPANFMVMAMVPDPVTGGVLYGGWDRTYGTSLRTWTWFDDRAAPETSITAGPTSPTNATSATFTFAGVDNVPTSGDITFTCRLDDTDPTACVSPITFDGLADGSHTFEVAATDSQGLVDPTPATRTWVVDTARPETTILTHPPDPTSRTDAIFTFTGSDDVTAVGGLVFTCSLDGGAFATCVSGVKYTGLAYGSHTFEVRARDVAGNVDPTPATFAWTAVDTGNSAPVPAPDSYTTDEDTALTVAAPGVLANDTDADTDQTLSALLVKTTTHGTLALNGDGSFTYTPASNFAGTDTFTYQASDGIVEVQATATITVTPVNDAPISNPDSYSWGEDFLLTVPGYGTSGVLANDTEVEHQALTATLVDDTVHGTLTFKADGSFTYMPDKDYFGLDTFTYTASDGTATSEPATVTIDVIWMEDDPVAVDDTYETAADTTLTVAVPGFLGNDINVDKAPGDPDWKDLVASVETMPTHGTLIVDPDPYGQGAGSGGFSYTPDAGFEGVDTFRYAAINYMTGMYSWETTGTVTITVTATANTTPESSDDEYTTAEDVTLTVSAADGVLTNDSDADGDALTAAKVTGPSHGTVDLGSDGSFTYTPAANFNGTDTFTYTAGDGTATDTATVTITVTPVNDPPVAVDDTYTTDEDTPLTVSLPGVLGNDSDVDGDSLTAIGVGLPAHGSGLVNTNGSLTYTPNPNYNGTDTFTYKANDSHDSSAVATVTITVNPVNDPPVAAADSYSVAEDDPVLTVTSTHGVLANDSDADGATLTAAKVTGPSHGTVDLGSDGSFTYTPAANFNGTDTFTYTAGDGTATDTATVTITVTPVDDPPAVPTRLDQRGPDGSIALGAGVHATSITFAGTGTDIDGDDIALEIEIHAVDSPFDDANLDRTTFLSTGSSLTKTISLVPGAYHWRVRAVDIDGTTGAWVSFGGNLETEADFVVRATTSLLYTGDQLVVSGKPFTPVAKLSSSAPVCMASQVVTFTAIDDNDRPAVLGAPTTRSDGQATVLSVDTIGWTPGIYTLRATFAGTVGCDSSTDEATLTVADPGDSATGGGWYTLSGSGRINLGFTVHRIAGTDPAEYTGKVLLINNGKWRLKGTLDDYVALGTSGAASGAGNLYRWDATLNDGIGDWVLSEQGVAFAISFADIGKGKTSEDAFGIHINHVIGVDEPNALPNSEPQLLKGGGITIHRDDGGTLPPPPIHGKPPKK